MGSVFRTLECKGPDDEKWYKSLSERHFQGRVNAMLLYLECLVVEKRKQNNLRLFEFVGMTAIVLFMALLALALFAILTQ